MGAHVAELGECAHRVLVALVERELGDDEHKLVLRLEPELAANGGDVAGGDAIGLEARGVDADAGHLDEAIRRHQ